MYPSCSIHKNTPSDPFLRSRAGFVFTGRVGRGRLFSLSQFFFHGSFDALKPSGSIRFYFFFGPGPILLAVFSQEQGNHADYHKKKRDPGPDTEAQRDIVCFIVLRQKADKPQQQKRYQAYEKENLPDLIKKYSPLTLFGRGFFLFRQWIVLPFPSFFHPADVNFQIFQAAGGF